MSKLSRKFQTTPAEIASRPEKSVFFEVDLPANVIQDDEMVVHSIQGELTLEVQRDALLCKGKMSASVQLICDRTLKPFDTQLDFVIEEAMQVSDAFEYGEDLAADSPVDVLKPDQKIDVLELIRQYLILNLPIIKISPESCYNDGLISLDHSASPEEEQQSDSPWAKIRQTVATWETSDKTDANKEVGN